MWCIHQSVQAQSEGNLDQFHTLNISRALDGSRSGLNSYSGPIWFPQPYVQLTMSWWWSPICADRWGCQKDDCLAFLSNDQKLADDVQAVFTENNSDILSVDWSSLRCQQSLILFSTPADLFVVFWGWWKVTHHMSTDDSNVVGDNADKVWVLFKKFSVHVVP